MLRNILDIFKIETGYDPDSDPNVRAACLEYINRGAKDLYNGLEADAMMREVVLVVQANAQITFPSFIGDIRGIREYGGYSRIPLNQIGVPRFTSDTWKYKFRNFTLKGKQPLHTSIVNASQIVFSTNTIENPPAQIEITGRTVNSKRIVEVVILDAVMKASVNSFENIDTISSNTRGRTYDIAASDVLGNQLAVLYNTDDKTQYILCDVSRYMWSAQTGDGINILAEVLYKWKFTKFYNDTDEFGADGYDDAIAYNALSLWCHGKEGKEQDAILYLQKCAEVANGAVSEAELGERRKLTHSPDPVLRSFSRLKNTYAWTRGRRFLGI